MAILKTLNITAKTHARYRLGQAFFILKTYHWVEKMTCLDTMNLFRYEAAKEVL